jgi:hypothetical protein
MLNSRSACPLAWKKASGTPEKSSIVCLKLWLSKGSFRQRTVKVKPFGFLAKTFLFSTENFGYGRR